MVVDWVRLDVKVGVESEGISLVALLGIDRPEASGVWIQVAGAVVREEQIGVPLLSRIAIEIPERGSAISCGQYYSKRVVNISIRHCAGAIGEIPDTSERVVTVITRR